MRRAAPALLVLASLLYPAPQKRNPQKPPDLEVLEVTARRSEGKITVDGRVRNCGEKTIQGIKLLFDFLAPGRQVVTTKNWLVEDEVLEPGKELEFNLQLVDPVRAVEFRINAEDRNARDLRTVNAGPFPIE